MASFCKKRDCPASQELLRVSTGNVIPQQREAVSRHFCECEFCRAELEFYRHYPQPTDIPQFEEIPAPLFDLATSLLNRNRDLKPLYKLMNGNGK